jgi:hypothetical protein
MSTPPTWPPPPPPPPTAPPPPPLGASAPETPSYQPAQAYPLAPPKKKMPTAAIVAIVLVVVFGGLMVVGIVAAIAIPALLRARTTANETSALGTLRTVTSAETAWATTHDGRYVPVACLGAPASCGDTAAVGLVPPEMASLEPHAGYEFGFVLRPGAESAPEPTASAGVGAGEASGEPTDADVRAELEKFSTPDTGATPPSSVETSPSAEPTDRGGFVLWASPSNPGVTGSRRFCIDETGLVRAYRIDGSWTAPSDAQPRCPDTGADVP